MPSNDLETYKDKNFCWTMDKRVVAVTVVRNVLLKRKRRAAERLERVREERRRR